MNSRRTLIRTALAAALALGVGLAAPVPVLAQGKTIKVANQGDALSLDPHSLNESFQQERRRNAEDPRRRPLNNIPQEPARCPQ
jgi:predicted RNase H-like nuclease (RuvC/YqgF family)